MRLHIREAVVRLSQRAEIAPNDAKAWDEITVRDVAELRQAMQADYDATQDPVKQVRLMRHYAEFAIENRGLFRRAFLFVRPEGAA